METDKPLAPLEDACTVVLLRDGASGLEVLMLERPGTSSAFAGAWVFPGGKVDPGDRIGPEGAALTDVQGAYVAGLREVAEETGLQLAPENLVWLSQWTPMQRLPRRFRTWFLIAAAPVTEVVLNPGEHENYAWLAPAEALRRHGAGTLTLAPPTWVTLYHLAEFTTSAEALTRTAAATPFAYESLLVEHDAGDSTPGAPAGIMWHGDAEYPGQAPVGARHRITMTALPWVYESTQGNPAPGN
jgi:8-oxo-dGTP pyrophosphatase MutT (NUDIX family)